MMSCPKMALFEFQAIALFSRVQNLEETSFSKNMYLMAWVFWVLLWGKPSWEGPGTSPRCWAPGWGAGSLGSPAIPGGPTEGTLAQPSPRPSQYEEVRGTGSGNLGGSWGELEPELSSVCSSVGFWGELEPVSVCFCGGSGSGWGFVVSFIHIW